MLLQTGTRTILEGNPDDTFFGVGMSIHSFAIWDSSKCKVKNVMGKMLESIRKKATRQEYVSGQILS